MRNIYYLHINAPSYFFDIMCSNQIPKEELDKISKRNKEKFLEIKHKKSLNIWFDELKKIYANNWSIVESEYNVISNKYNFDKKKLSDLCPSNIDNELDKLLSLMEEGDIVCTDLYRGVGSFYVYNDGDTMKSTKTISEYGYVLPSVAQRKYTDYIIRFKMIDYLNFTDNGNIIKNYPYGTLSLKLCDRNFLLTEDYPDDILSYWNFYC